MSEVWYTEEHEYLRLEGETAVVGITNYAQDKLGDIVFVELPEVGKAVDQGAEAAVVESVKAASEVYAPASGEVTEVNDALDGEPQLVNQAPHGEGWFFKMKLKDKGELDKLMSEDAYKTYIEGLT